MEGDIPKYNSETEHQHRMRKQRSIIKFCRKCDLCKGLRFWPLSIYKCKDCTFKCHKKCWRKYIRDQESSSSARGQEQDVTTEPWNEIETPANYQSREPSSTELSQTAMIPYVRPYSSMLAPYVSQYDYSPAPYESSYSSSPAPHVCTIDRPSATEMPGSNMASALQLTRTTTEVRTVQVTRSYTYVTRTTTSLALDADGCRSTVALTSLRTVNTAISSQQSRTSATVCSGRNLTSGNDDYQRKICEYDETERSAVDCETSTIDDRGPKDRGVDQAVKADVTTRKIVGAVAYGRSKSDVGFGAGKKKSRFTRVNGRAKSAG